MPEADQCAGQVARHSVVIGVTDSQTCLVLRGRLRAFKAAGFRVTVLCSPGPLLVRIAAEEDVDFIGIPMDRDISPWADVRSLLLIVRALRRVRPALTEFSTPKAGLLGSVAALLCRVPVRIYLLRGLRLETVKGLKRTLLLAAERVAAAASHSVICNSESLRARTAALRIAPENKLRLIGEGSSNGVDVERFHPAPSALRKRLGIPPSVPVIGFVGRFTRDKGVPELIDAFDRVLESCPSARLLLVGWFDKSADAISDELRRRIEHHPRIVCTGFVPDTAPYYRGMDMMVLPTWREGFPNVVLEAAATGIPVVTTFSTGSRDAVIPEVTGLLVPPGYPEAIAEAVLRLIRDPDRRYRMGRAARAWVQERFLRGHVLGLTVAYYSSLLDEKTAPLTRDISEESALAVD